MVRGMLLRMWSWGLALIVGLVCGVGGGRWKVGGGRQGGFTLERRRCDCILRSRPGFEWSSGGGWRRRGGRSRICRL